MTDHHLINLESWAALKSNLLLFLLCLCLYAANGHQCHGVCVWWGKVKEQLRVHSLIHLYMGSGNQIMLSGLRRELLNLLSYVGGN